MTEFPRRLHHDTPAWVKAGAVFHVRLRVAPTQATPLVAAELARELLAAARRYHAAGRWWCELILLMPDHLHAMLAFPQSPGMAATLRDWKRATARFQGTKWQENFFDHRVRNDREREETWHYIRRNPVAKQLCAEEEAWPWWWSGVLGESEESVLGTSRSTRNKRPGGTR